MQPHRIETAQALIQFLALTHDSRIVCVDRIPPELAGFFRDTGYIVQAGIEAICENSHRLLTPKTDVLTIDADIIGGDAHAIRPVLPQLRCCSVQPVVFGQLRGCREVQGVMDAAFADQLLSAGLSPIKTAFCTGGRVFSHKERLVSLCALLSGFAISVYEAVLQIPSGRVSTYAEIARYLDCKSPRAIGQTLKKNPFAPYVPCHRVIASDFTLGGFRGSTAGKNVDSKRHRLELEGVGFTGGRLADPERLFTFGLNNFDFS